MRVQWSIAAQHDLVRLAAFLKPVNPRAASQVAGSLIKAAGQLPDYPFIAPRVEAYIDRDIRSLIVDDYNMHYEIKVDVIFIVRIWHVREDR